MPLLLIDRSICSDASETLTEDAIGREKVILGTLGGGGVGLGTNLVCHPLLNQLVWLLWLFIHSLVCVDTG